MSNWRYRRKLPVLLLAGVLALLLAGVDNAAAGPHREATLEPCRPARTDTVLSWDDGDCGSIYNEVSGQNGMMLAVRFQAPPWADFITEIRYYIRDDHVENPEYPGEPTTQPFAVRVWKPNPDVLPGEYGNEFQISGSLYPEEAWLELPLANPVDISDNGEYPDRVFFVGLEWGHSWNPVIGIDTDLPIDFSSFRWNWSYWEILMSDAMIRAVVSDGTSPVEVSTWTTIKAMFR